jgi:hypothetical protein
MVDLDAPFAFLATAAAAAAATGASLAFRFFAAEVAAGFGAAAVFKVTARFGRELISIQKHTQYRARGKKKRLKRTHTLKLQSHQ